MADQLRLSHICGKNEKLLLTREIILFGWRKIGDYFHLEAQTILLEIWNFPFWKEIWL